MPPCDGALVRVHLIPKRMIHTNRWHDSLYVWACGGPMGNAGHHGELDSSKKLRIPYSQLPLEFLEAVQVLGLDWWVLREYG